MNIRGLEVLLGTLGGVLLVLGITTGLTWAALGWAVVGVALVLMVEATLLRQLLPYYGATRHWAQVADRSPGLRLLGDGGRTPPRVRGTMNNCAVFIDRTRTGWRIMVFAHHRDDQVDVQLSLRPAGKTRSAHRTGDPTFDRLVDLHAPGPEGLLVLDALTRAEALDAVTSGVWVDVDRLEWSSPVPWSAEQVIAHLDRMTALAGRLFDVTPTKLRARARTTILEDPHADARARALWVYQEHYAPDDEDRITTRAACADENPSVRLAAAGAALVAGAAPDGDLARAVADATCPPWALPAAVDRLLEHGGSNTIAAAFYARFDGQGPLPIEILRWRLGRPDPVDGRTLGDRLMRAPTDDVIAAIPALVAACPALESTLIVLLDHPADAVGDRVLEGLAFRGSFRALDALTRVTRSFRSRRVRHCAQDALDAIRARGPRGSEGLLSLSDPNNATGRLSATQDAKVLDDD